MSTLSNQLGRHAVALISLAVALTGLGYNTWRNEQTEANRNVRTAGFQILLKLGELDELVFFSHYQRDQMRGNSNTGWAYVLTVRDLGTLTREPASGATAQLLQTWEANWEGLGSDQAAADNISKAIDRARDNVRVVMNALD